MFTLEKYHNLLKWDQCEKFVKEIADKAQYILAITEEVQYSFDEHQYDDAIKKIDKTVDDMEKLWENTFEEKLRKSILDIRELWESTSDMEIK